MRPSPLYTPPPAVVRATTMASFRAAAAARFGLAGDEHAHVHAWSVEEPAAFWPFLAEFCGLRFTTPARETLSAAPMPRTRWFDGGTLNYAEHALEHADLDAVAVISVDDRQQERRITRRELRTLVGRCARVLDELGVVAGDRVASYLPNGVEAVVVLLACAARGAIFTSCAPPMGIEAVVDRFAQVAPKVLFAADGHWEAGKHQAFELARLIASLPSVEHVICVPSHPERAPEHPTWADRVDRVDRADSDLHYTPLPFDHPIYILYTSGTTGLPKCIVHRAGGALLTHLKEQRLHCDVNPGDIVFYQTTTGWMMWNWLVSALAAGATILAHAGSTFYPSRDALWRLADRHAVTHFGTSASHIHNCMRIAMRPRDAVELRALRCVMSTGSPLSPEGFAWIYDAVKSEVHLASISGGTDIVGCFMLGDPTRPVYAGQIQGPALGVDLCAFDEQGEPVEGAPGELVVRRPLPSMPLHLWGDRDGSKYAATYFPRGDYWFHGDRIELTPERGIIVWGRSDATLKPGGVRIGTGELYRALEAVPEVLEALAVGKRQGADVSVWLFVVLREGHTLDRALRQQISNTILKRTTPQHVPQSIYQVRDLPRTHSGKLMELAATRAINGEEVVNVAAIANPSALDELRSVIRRT
ncbi:MAG TPA: acetoacetate--CoA ligase [Kofleriaceae bacterium]|nr:acetoacetate--CoA ligase [Kofleriaceae bacterium]